MGFLGRVGGGGLWVMDFCRPPMKILWGRAGESGVASGLWLESWGVD